MSVQKKDIKIKPNFNKITISLASPEIIQERSRGEVLKPETINYRSYKPERDGLFCEKIFGPVKDWECHCGKYKRIRYKGIVCDRCGVEVTEKKVRRERMGHIELTVPVAHIWYFRSLPNKIGTLLGMQSKKLDQVIYYERYLIIQPGRIGEEKGWQAMDLITEEEYLDTLESMPKEELLMDNEDPRKFIAKMGAEALEMVLSRLNLEVLAAELREQANNETSQQRKTEALKRLKIVNAFRNANKNIENRPEWMIIRIVPVIPPELRPLVPLDGGRFATSDLNDLYRRVIIRNNRLKRLMEIKAPDVILRNEKRMLQEAVDSLFDNSRKVNAVRSDGNRALKSLSDMLKGKQGRFRQNLLGKRVDYSGRSVIVVGPELKLNECGLPKAMAAELFKPFIIRKLIERGIVKTVKSAKKVVDRKEAIVWDILENVLKGHPVLLNRAPTLHRLGIQAFQPKLIEDKAIRLHPLVCTAFNADFDGDQMAVHVPLSHNAVLEASLLMLASHNILNPANGQPITVPSQDMVLGIYYMTKQRKGVKGEGRKFYSPEEVIIAYNEGAVHLNAKIHVRVPVLENDTLVTKLVHTSVGRVLFNQIVPQEVGYQDRLLTKGAIREVIGLVFKKTNMQRTAYFLDDLKNLGYRFAFKGGLSFSLANVKVPAEKQKYIAEAEYEVSSIRANYDMGFITENERYNQVIDIWTRVNSKVTEALLKQVSEDDEGFNPVYMMLDSGARGSKEQIRQLGGMRGLMAKPQKNLSGSSGEIIENPILSNFREGLNVMEYFISTHGARKGLADTALKTADAGYLTRRLVDVANDVVITEKDCGTLRGIETFALKKNDDIVESLYERILGRVTAAEVLHPQTGEVIVPEGVEITEEIADYIEKTGIESVVIRSVLTCEAKRGVCAKCYGRNLATGRLVQKGEAVGVIAAQSIGEPGTQLTLRTFHTGGAASRISAEHEIKAKYEGTVRFDAVSFVERIDKATGQKQRIVLSRRGEVQIVDNQNRVLVSHRIPYGSEIRINDGDKTEKNTVICQWDPYNSVILAETKGKVQYENLEENINFRRETDENTGTEEVIIIETRDKTKNPLLRIIPANKEELISKPINLPVNAHLVAESGDEVMPGDILVKIPRQTAKTRDITGGLPRVTELFEARQPSNPAVVSDIDGVVSISPDIKRGNREVWIEADSGERKKYLVPVAKHILVQDGDYVRAGDELTDGAISPSDILRIKGPNAVQEYLVNEIQEVYRLQGVKINNKHIEVIVRQMMQKVEIIDAGDTEFLEKEVVDKQEFQEANDNLWGKKYVLDPGDSKNLRAGMIVSFAKIRDENSTLKRKDLKLVEFRDAIPATAQPILQGITTASLGTRSFMSAASFQETTKVLNEAAIQGRVDHLLGLKENVIVGHLIPAGTGLREFQNMTVHVTEKQENLPVIPSTTRKTAKRKV